MKLFSNCKKIGLYGRESSREQVEKGFNLEGQFDRCHDWLNIYSDQYAGERVEYIEKGISGTKWRRKELQRLVKDIKDGVIGTVIIHNLDRLTRSIIDLSKLLEIFEKYQVEFISVQEKIETNTPQGRFFMFLIVLVAQWEVEANRDRTKRGVHKSALMGNWAKTRVPIGYDKKEKKIYKNLIESEVVDRIFNLFVFDQYSINQIAIYFDSIGVLGMRWDDKKIALILKNAAYIGMYITDDIKIENHHEPLIKESTFYRAQERMLQREHVNKIDYLFKGVPVKCHNCGEMLCCTPTIKPNKIYRYLECERCNQRINEDKLFVLISQQLVDYVNNEMISQEVLKKIRVIKSKDKKLRNLSFIYSSGLISEETYEEMKSKVLNEIKINEQEINITKNSKEIKRMRHDQKRRLIEFSVNHVSVNLILKTYERIGFKEIN